MNILEEEKNKNTNNTAATNDIYNKNNNTNNINLQDRVKMAKKFFDLLYEPVKECKYSYLWLKQGETKKITIPFDVSKSENRAEMARQAIKHNDDGYDVFFGVCLTDTPPISPNRAKAKDITLQVAIWTDVDTEGGTHINDKEKGKIYPPNFDTAKSFLPAEASILINSSYGLHGYKRYTVPLVINDDNRESAKKRNKDYIDTVKRNADKFEGVDGVQDLARVLRVPGTYNFKLGRENAPLCHIVEVNDITYSTDEIDKLIENNRTDQLNPADKITAAIPKNYNQPFNSNYKHDRIIRMLDFIDPSCDYNEWTKVGMDLKHLGFTFEVWENWSRKSSKYKSIDDCMQHWKTFSEIGDAKSAEGALCNKAKDGGYNEQDFKKEWQKNNPEQNITNSTINDEENETEKIIEEFAKEGDFTDLDCAELMIKLYGKHLKFCHDLDSWFLYEGGKWQQTPTKSNRLLYSDWFTIANKVINILKEKYNKVKHFENDSDKLKTAIAKAAKNKLKESQILKSNHKAENIIKNASGMNETNLFSTRLNNDDCVLNVKNGTIDLRNGQLKPHNPDDLISLIANVIYDPDAKSELWDNFIKSVFPDKGLREYFQKYCGYMLTGNTDEQKFAFMQGKGGSGKGVTVETIADIFGDYATSFPIEMLMESYKSKDGEEATPQLMNLRGRRMIYTSESKQGTKFDEPELKRWTGQDTINIRPLYSSPIAFKPKFKLIIVGNYRPALADSTDPAIKRRLHLLPCNNVPDDEKIDIRLKSKLTTEENKSAILNWLLEGLKMYNKQGLKDKPEAMQSALENYYAENDDIDEFVTAQNYILAVNAKINCKDMFDKYKDWCKNEGKKPPRRADFYDMLLRRYQDNGVTLSRKRENNKRNVFVGIGFSDKKENSPTTPNQSENQTNTFNTIEETPNSSTVLDSDDWQPPNDDDYCPLGD